MRALRIAVVLVGGALFAPDAGASKNRLAAPRSVVVNFDRQNRVKFEITDAKVAAVSVYIAGSVLTVPGRLCAKMHEVHFDSVVLIYGSSLSPDEAPTADDWFEVRFDVGPESNRFFGSLQQIELAFRGGKFSGATITQRRGDTWVTEDL
jgi:hypothetical protein